MRAWIWAAAIGLAGCVSPGMAPSGVGTVRAVPKPGVVAPPAQGEAQLVVRTAAAATPGAEIAGATCVAETPFSRVAFASPARVLMPDFGAQAPTVSVTCEAGAARGSATAAPVAAWQGGLGGWPAVGVSVGTGNAGGVGLGLGWYGGGVGGASGVPVTRYNELRVLLQ